MPILLELLNLVVDRGNNLGAALVCLLSKYNHPKCDLDQHFQLLTLAKQIAEKKSKHGGET